jgi:hypothetical protein
MLDLNYRTVEEETIAVEYLLEGNRTGGIIPRLLNLLGTQRRNLQNLSALVSFNFLAAGFFFVTQIKIANVIGKEGFGLLAYGIALGMYAQTIVRYGMNRTLVRDLVHYPNRFAELVMASQLLRGVVLGLVVAGLLIWKLLWHPADLTWAVVAVVVAYASKSLDLQPVGSSAGVRCLELYGPPRRVQHGPEGIVFHLSLGRHFRCSATSDLDLDWCCPVDNACILPLLAAALGERTYRMVME